MGKSFKRALVRVIAGAAIVLCAATAWAAGSANAPKDDRAALLAEGRKTASFCANCHGEAGLSHFPDVPNLAGQNPAYLLRQLDAFTAGRRKNAFMEGLVKMLSPTDRAGVVAYFASLPVEPSRRTPGPLAEQGGKAFARICAECHGPEALGGNEFPRLAGQQSEYLRINLKRYLHPTAERSYGPMTVAVMRLGEENIDAVVDYLSSLRVASDGRPGGAPPAAQRSAGHVR